MPGYIGREIAQELSEEELLIIPPDMDLYKAKSQKVKQIFQEYDAQVTMKGLDEGTLELTEYISRRKNRAKSENSASKSPEMDDIESVVAEMREKIFQETGLTCSAGIGPNPLIAKLCSDLNKPNGQYKMEDNTETILDFVRNLRNRVLSTIIWLLSR